jgi:hypothetical protein
MADFDATALVRDYGDPLAEARACRESCALFDFSFMSRARIGGSGSVEALARLQSRPMADLAAGRIRYGMRLDAAGAVAADRAHRLHGRGRAQEVRRDGRLEVEARPPRKQVGAATTRRPVADVDGDTRLVSG